MSKASFVFVLCFILFIFIPGCAGKTKEPAVAGSFYPADPATLRESVDAFISAAPVAAVEGKLIALIAPHAGYDFSGAIAGHTYRRLKDADINTVILIGPSHYASFEGASVYAEGKMRTPLGDIRIDEDVARSLLDEKAGVRSFSDAFAREHSLEVQLPFLQRSLKNFSVVPVLIGSPTRESLAHLTAKISEIVRKSGKAIVIASTDLSHYHDYSTAVAMDRKAVDAVGRMSLADLERALMGGEAEMCGGFPVILTLAVAARLGATNGLLYAYANSGDVTGDRSRVVGYAAMGLYNSGLGQTDRRELLSLAKNTITEYVTTGRITEPAPPSLRLAANGATFVTISKKGALRGCIGNLEPNMPLYRSVVHNAVSAAARDPRFPPLTKEELKEIDVEISVLSPFEPVSDPSKIEIGKHGLFLVNGINSGVLLPQVPVQFGWDRETFLRQVSAKAGLPEEAWKKSELYFFTADVIR